MRANVGRAAQSPAATGLYCRTARHGRLHSLPPLHPAPASPLTPRPPQQASTGSWMSLRTCPAAGSCYAANSTLSGAPRPADPSCARLQSGCHYAHSFCYSGALWLHTTSPLPFPHRYSDPPRSGSRAAAESAPAEDQEQGPPDLPTLKLVPGANPDAVRGAAVVPGDEEEEELAAAAAAAAEGGAGSEAVAAPAAVAAAVAEQPQPGSPTAAAAGALGPRIPAAPTRPAANTSTQQQQQQHAEVQAAARKARSATEEEEGPAVDEAVVFSAPCTWITPKHIVSGGGCSLPA